MLTLVSFPLTPEDEQSDPVILKHRQIYLRGYVQDIFTQY